MFGRKDCQSPISTSINLGGLPPTPSGCSVPILQMGEKRGEAQGPGSRASALCEGRARGCEIAPNHGRYQQVPRPKATGVGHPVPIGIWVPSDLGDKKTLQGLTDSLRGHGSAPLLWLGRRPLPPCPRFGIFLQARLKCGCGFRPAGGEPLASP